VYPERTGNVASDGKIAFKGNGNGNGHTPNGRGVGYNIAKESVGLGIAELVSMGVSLGVVGVADQVAPKMLKSCSQTLGKILEPYLDTIEKSLKAVCKLEECQPDATKSREERAENIGKTLIVFSSAWATSMLFKIATRKWMNDALGLTVKAPRTGSKWQDFKNDYLIPSAHDKKVIVWDEITHYGSLLLLNTGMAKTTDEMLRTTTNILEKVGFSPRKAHDLATMGIIWELPNALGFAAGVGNIAKYHLHDKPRASHVEKLAQHTALGSSVHPTV